MKIIFGLELDDEVFPRAETERGVFVAGPKRLLHIFETWLGLAGRRERTEHLRIEAFRQILTQYLMENESVFFRKSFDADPLACAQTLLELRDELLLAGFDFESSPDMPHRLAALCAVEQQMNAAAASQSLTWGIAERLTAVLTALKIEKTPLVELMVVEPLELLPPQYQRLFSSLSDQQVTVRRVASPHFQAIATSDLDVFKLFLLKNSKFSTQYFNYSENLKFQNDGSLLLVTGRRETDLAAWFAKLLQKNKDFRPVLLLPERTRVLDNALTQEGMPSLGLPSNSTARPTLQLLKLVTTFLWRPLDPYKILEFVTLAAKPIADDLAWVIARTLSTRPGVRSDLWIYEINAYFAKLAERSKTEAAAQSPEDIRREYDFWFARETFDPDRGAPRTRMVEIFDYLTNWAIAENERTDGKNASLLVLAEQARRIKELLETLPPHEQMLTQLELERIIRTIYEATPVQPRPQEVAALPFVAKPTALVADVPQLLWWNCVDTEPDYFFSRFYDHEITFLRTKNIVLQSPQNQNALQLWQREQAVLRVQSQLVLVMPDRINGADVTEHPLLSYLHACFGEKNIQNASISIKNHLENIESKLHFLHLPYKNDLPVCRFEPPAPFIQLQRDFKALNETREHETPTSLETLFYFPHKWVFKHRAKLNASPILSVTSDTTLKGNLAHRFFEEFLKEDFHNWGKKELEYFIENLEKNEGLLAREAAVLLMYGQETERVRFMNIVKKAAWAMLQLLKTENWKVLGTEVDLKGLFEEKMIRGRADVVLTRGEELAVVDLKWSNATKRKNEIKSQEDLQLTLYSQLLTDDDRLAHTSFFIIENAKMISRTKKAFNEAEAVDMESDHFSIQEKIWEKMRKTYNWRMKQIQDGAIEIRAEHTLAQLAIHYAEESLLDLLEMKKDASKYDDYKTLIADLK
ncbi:MAG: hypothetical protein RL757_2762 [Bacteroidota bacterium]|jgi:hypothetical protein